ncbi:MAG: PA2817 family protein [Chromatocurvus sp.]
MDTARMNDSEYLEHCRGLLARFADEMTTRTRELPAEDSLRELALDFSAIAAGERDLYVEGPQLVSRLFTTYPDFAPTFPRDLLWFFGGECLHYMPDDEIAEFEQRFADNT